MESMTVMRYDPEPADAPTRYQVGFDVVLENGQLRHYPVTVYAADLADQLPSTVVAAAEAMVLPGIAAEEAPAVTPQDDGVVGGPAPEGSA